MTRPIELGLLGPPTLRVDGEPVRMPAGRQAGLLALLSLAEGRSVSAGQLGSELWPQGTSTRQGVHVLVCRTRRLLGARSDALETVGDAYRLAVEQVTTDLAEFRDLVQLAAGAAAGGNAPRAATLLDVAQLLWRGRLFDGLHGFPFADQAASGIEDERLTAVEERLELHLACGEPGRVVPGAREIILGHPYRERPWRLLMTALTRSGRRREALLAFQQLHTHLTAVGLEPELATVRLEREIASASLEVSA